MTTRFSDAKAKKTEEEKHGFDNWPSVCALCNARDLVRMHESNLFSLDKLQLSHHPGKYSKMRIHLQRWQKIELWSSYLPPM